MRTVTEAAQLVGVSAGTVRLWERQGLVSPGRDAAGRRTYDQEAIERLRKIAWWRRVRGLNAAAIRRILDEEDYAGLGRAVVPTGADGPDDTRPLRPRRQLAGLTLRELSRRSGLSVSFLSAVERGLNNPSPTAAARITAALQDTGAVDLQTEPRLHRLGTGKRVDVAPGITYEWLSAFSGLMEPQLVTVRSGAWSEGTYAHSGEEFLVVLAGRLDMTLNGVTETLTTRDSLQFDSHVPHSWGNPGDVETEVLWVTTERGVWSGGSARHDGKQAPGRDDGKEPDEGP
ncbi:MAG: MerR family transcriptional regulator [Pseudonocardia sp.]